MSKRYALKDRDGTIHEEPSREAALIKQQAYGGMVVTTTDTGTWKPYKSHRALWWALLVVLAVQAFFAIRLATLATSHPSPTPADIASWCGTNKSAPGYQDCVVGSVGTYQSGHEGENSVSMFITILLWIAVDVMLAVGFLIYWSFRHNMPDPPGGGWISRPSSPAG
jgi:hypothetical protein